MDHKNISRNTNEKLRVNVNESLRRQREFDAREVAVHQMERDLLERRNVYRSLAAIGHYMKAESGGDMAIPVSIVTANLGDEEAVERQVYAVVKNTYIHTPSTLKEVKEVIPPDSITVRFFVRALIGDESKGIMRNTQEIGLVKAPISGWETIKGEQVGAETYDLNEAPSVGTGTHPVHFYHASSVATSEVEKISRAVLAQIPTMRDTLSLLQDGILELGYEYALNLADKTGSVSFID